MQTERPIALFLPSLGAGGAERVFLLLAEFFAKTGRRCDIVVSAGGGVWEERVPSGVRVVSLGGLKPLFSVVRLAHYLRRERPAVLMSSVFPANIAALVASSITRTPCVLREANRTADDIRTAHPIGTISNRIAMRLLYPRAQAIIALTPGLAAHLSGLAHVPLRRIFVIPNPVIRSARPKSPPETREPLILGCGRLVPQKDFALLLEAFALLAPKRDARLVILGEGPLDHELRAQSEALGIADRVEFAGHCSDAGAWMTRARVFALSSRWEGFPNVLLEALSAGCHMVATDCSDAVGEVLGDGRYGTIVPIGNVEAMAIGLSGALADAIPREIPAEHLDRYELESIAMRYLEVLDKASGKVA